MALFTSLDQKHLTFSRAYIDFDNPDDVIEFAELFNGHVFVNEKGTQYKFIVEYAPSQRVPKQLCKNDGREGTIYKDPEYLEFLEYISKPIENLQCRDTTGEEGSRRIWCSEGYSYSYSFNELCASEKSCKGWSSGRKTHCFVFGYYPFLSLLKFT